MLNTKKNAKSHIAHLLSGFVWYFVSKLFPYLCRKSSAMQNVKRGEPNRESAPVECFSGLLADDSQRISLLYRVAVLERYRKHRTGSG